MEAARNVPTNPIEQSFFLSEILGARVMLDKKKVGKLADLVMKENGPLPVVTHLLVSRPFGETALVAWESVSQISNHSIEINVENIEALPKEPPEGAIQVRDHILDKKALDLEGREVEVVVPVDRWALRHWDVAVGDWAVEPGTFEVHVGRSVADTRLTARIEA